MSNQKEYNGIFAGPNANENTSHLVQTINCLADVAVNVSSSTWVSLRKYGRFETGFIVAVLFFPYLTPMIGLITRIGKSSLTKSASILAAELGYITCLREINGYDSENEYH